MTTDSPPRGAAPPRSPALALALLGALVLAVVATVGGHQAVAAVLAVTAAAWLTIATTTGSGL